MEEEEGTHSSAVQNCSLDRNISAARKPLLQRVLISSSKLFLAFFYVVAIVHRGGIIIIIYFVVVDNSIFFFLFFLLLYIIPYYYYYYIIIHFFFFFSLQICSHVACGLPEMLPILACNVDKSSLSREKWQGIQG